MLLNAEFDKPVLLHGQSIPWQSSPMPGVDRRPLDRIGDEVARATTIVRYAEGSHFSPHTHDGGEEFVVLDGVFEDEHGAFPVGSYIRNPPTSRHTPGSTDGCVIFVKLWQFDPADRQQVHVDMSRAAAQPDAARRGGEVTPLFADARETVTMETWAPGTRAAIAAPGGAEVLVLSGAATFGDEALERWSWIRHPSGQDIDLTAGPDGLRVWIKTGHLDHVSAPPVA